MVAVLDASAVLALLLNEDGGPSVLTYLDDAHMSAVNLAEVLSRLAHLGMPVPAAMGFVDTLNLTIAPFMKSDTLPVAELRVATAQAGVSLGDRACLALAGRMACPAITADRAWVDLSLDIEVISIR